MVYENLKVLSISDVWLDFHTDVISGVLSLVSTIPVLLSFIQQQVKLIHFAWVLHTTYYHQAFV